MMEEQAVCRHYPKCGGCMYQDISYDAELRIKEEQVRKMLAAVIGEEKYDKAYQGITPSPLCEGYRNKMELSFGDCQKGGPLTLGMHKKRSFYDVLPTTDCLIAGNDMRIVSEATLSYFRKKGVSYYHKRRHEGYLRHLLIRESKKTGQLLVDLVTSGDTKDLPCDEEMIINEWCELIKNQDYTGSLVGILHTRNDRPADVVEDQGTTVLYGNGEFEEELLGLRFKITPFSFFQTNSLGAEKLYGIVRDWISEGKKTYNTIFDLYCGTGTIAQIVAPIAKKVVGVEIIKEAVGAAIQNAKVNNLDNCSFIAQDVTKALDEIEERPDYIILDPPRSGVHPKGLPKILSYGVENILYISCKPQNLVSDIPACLEAGYKVERIMCVDLFPRTGNVETICMLRKQNRTPDTYIELEIDADEYMDIINKSEK